MADESEKARGQVSRGGIIKPRETDQPDKGTGDPVRDAIIAQGMTTNTSRVAMPRPRPSVWQPPTEEELKSWFFPDDVIESNRTLEANGEQIAIVQRLRGGRIIAVAATADRFGRGGSLETLVWIDKNVWREADGSELHHFWNHGDLIVRRTSREGTEYYYDVKFDPQSFSQNPPKPPSATSTQLEALDATDDRPNLSRADAERFCRAILAGWGNEVKQDWAFDKAVLFFPDKKVRRDAFRSILRSIRGPMKPGKRPKTTD